MTLRRFRAAYSSAVGALATAATHLTPLPPLPLTSPPTGSPASTAATMTLAGEQPTNGQHTFKLVGAGNFKVCQGRRAVCLLRRGALLQRIYTLPSSLSSTPASRGSPSHPQQPTLHPSAPALPAPSQRNNPRSDRFPMHKFDHVEFWCGDATTTSGRWAVSPIGVVQGGLQGCLVRQRHCHRPPPHAPLHRQPKLHCPPALHPTSCCRFGFGLGLTQVAKSDQSTGNHHFASYVMQSGASMASIWGRKAAKDALPAAALRAPSLYSTCLGGSVLLLPLASGGLAWYTKHCTMR